MQIYSRILLSLLLITATPLTCLSSQSEDEAAVKDLVGRMIAAYSARDLEAFMSLYSPKSPEFATRKSSISHSIEENETVSARELTILSTSVTGSKATVRAKWHMAATRAKTGKPAS